MSLTPEVQAACVSVAGDWAIRLTQFQKNQGSKEKVVTLLKQNFEGVYAYLVSVAEKQQS
jgi:hypothetical protein